MTIKQINTLLRANCYKSHVKKRQQKLALEQRSELALIMGIFQPRAQHTGEDSITPQRVAVTAARMTC